MTVVRDLIVGAIGALAIGVTCSAPKKAPSHTRKRPRIWEWSRGLAGISYSLYLLHMPVIAFIHAGVYRQTGTKWYPDLPHAVLGFGVLALCILYAYVVASCTERYTDRVRKFMLQSLTSRTAG